MAKINTQYIPESTRNRKDFDVKAGDTIKVHLKIQEKGKTRIQTFEGLVLARKHGSENGGTITVRKVSNGVGVERIFPIYSPAIDSIEITRRAKVRRSKLYFLRDAVAKTMRYKLRRISDIKSSSADLPAWETAEEIIPEDAEMEAEVEPEVNKAEAVEETKEATTEKDADVAEVKAEETKEVKEESSTEADDLTKIEGIGPVIAKTLAENDITTFAALADAKDEDTQEMIKDIKGNHQAGTWNEQAALARDGKWDELKKLQDELDGGVEK